MRLARDIDNESFRNIPFFSFSFLFSFLFKQSILHDSNLISIVYFSNKDSMPIHRDARNLPRKDSEVRMCVVLIKYGKIKGWEKTSSNFCFNKFVEDECEDG